MDLEELKQEIAEREADLKENIAIRKILLERGDPIVRYVGHIIRVDADRLRQARKRLRDELDWRTSGGWVR